jgi:hypothetical protein
MSYIGKFVSSSSKDAVHGIDIGIVISMEDRDDGHGIIYIVLWQNDATTTIASAADLELFIKCYKTWMTV